MENRERDISPEEQDIIDAIDRFKTAINGDYTSLKKLEEDTKELQGIIHMLTNARKRSYDLALKNLDENGIYGIESANETIEDNEIFKKHIKTLADLHTEALNKHRELSEKYNPHKNYQLPIKFKVAINLINEADSVMKEKTKQLQKKIDQLNTSPEQAANLEAKNKAELLSQRERINKRYDQEVRPLETAFNNANNMTTWNRDNASLPKDIKIKYTEIVENLYQNEVFSLRHPATDKEIEDSKDKLTLFTGIVNHLNDLAQKKNLKGLKKLEGSLKNADLSQLKTLEKETKKSSIDTTELQRKIDALEEKHKKRWSWTFLSKFPWTDDYNEKKQYDDIIKNLKSAVDALESTKPKDNEVENNIQVDGMKQKVKLYTKILDHVNKCLDIDVDPNQGSKVKHTNEQQKATKEGIRYTLGNITAKRDKLGKISIKGNTKKLEDFTPQELADLDRKLSTKSKISTLEQDEESLSKKSSNVTEPPQTGAVSRVGGVADVYAAQQDTGISNATSPITLTSQFNAQSPAPLPSPQENQEATLNASQTKTPQTPDSDSQSKDESTRFKSSK